MNSKDPITAVRLAVDDIANTHQSQNILGHKLPSDPVHLMLSSPRGVDDEQ